MNNERIPAHMPSATILGDVHMGQSPIPIPIGRAITTKRTMRISTSRPFMGSRLPVMDVCLTRADAPFTVAPSKASSSLLSAVRGPETPEEAQQQAGKEAVIQSTRVDQALQHLSLEQGDETRCELIGDIAPQNEKILRDAANLAVTTL